MRKLIPFFWLLSILLLPSAARLIDKPGEPAAVKPSPEPSLEELLPLMKVSENVYCVGRAGWGGFKPLSRGGNSNVFLIDGGSELALVDVGMTAGVDDTLKNVRALGFDPAKITKVFLTHSHWDHAAGLAELQKRLPNAKVYGHRLCKETMGDGPGIYAVDYKPLGHVGGNVGEVVKDGDTVQVGKIKVGVIALPGHTPDSTGYLIDQATGRCCFTGDAAIGDQGKIKGVVGWISANWRSKLNAFDNTIDRLANLKLATIYPGHGLSIVGVGPVAESLKNCKWRLKQLMDIPDLGSMMPGDF